MCICQTYLSDRQEKTLLFLILFESEAFSNCNLQSVSINTKIEFFYVPSKFRKGRALIKIMQILIQAHGLSSKAFQIIFV